MHESVTVAAIILLRILFTAAFQRPHFFSTNTFSGGVYQFSTRAPGQAVNFGNWRCRMVFKVETDQGMVFFGEEDGNYVSVSVFGGKTFFFLHRVGRAPFHCILHSPMQLGSWNLVTVGKYENRVLLSINKDYTSCHTDTPSILDVGIPRSIHVGGLMTGKLTFARQRSLFNASLNALEAALLREDDSRESINLTLLGLNQNFLGVLSRLEFVNLAAETKLELITTGHLRVFTLIDGYLGNVREYTDDCKCSPGEACVEINSVTNGYPPNSYSCEPCPVSCFDGSVCLKLNTSDWCVCAEATSSTDTCSLGSESLCDKDRPVCVHGICYEGGKEAICICELFFTGRACDICMLDKCYNGLCKQVESSNDTDGAPSYICQCYSGWYGLKCDSTTPCYSNPCIHGTCSEPNPGKLQCDCEVGWTGDYCQQSTPCLSKPCLLEMLSNPIALNMTFASPSCPLGFTGISCDEPIDECASMPCNGGICIDGVAIFVCACPQGYAGDTCQTNIDDCGSGPCKHGKCQDKVDGFECICESGFSDILCTEDINECGQHQCERGQCIDGVNGYTCACPEGFSGVYCQEETDECKSQPCANGLCRDANNSIMCVCEPGFTGHVCQTDINECYSTPCLDGTCIDQPNHYNCSCQVGTFGRNCELDEDVCASEPCIYGQCLNVRGSFRCSCHDGFTGRLCETEIDECSSTPCGMWTCVDRVNQYTCECTPGYSGDHCEIELNGCGSYHCVFGSCTAGKNSYFCLCQIGYSGQMCDVEVNECDSGPCKYGTCLDLFASYRCECNTGYTGANCESNVDECLSSPCDHGDCIDELNVYSCVCEEGYSGPNCGEKTDDCASEPCLHGNCSDSGNMFSCTCQLGYSGSRCELNMDECLSQPCVYGVCDNQIGYFVCHCEHGYSGPLCDKNSCRSSPCLRGNCSSFEDGYNCLCEEGFRGRDCSEDINECLEIQCHHGECREDIVGFTCLCDPGFSGTFCDSNIDECSSSPCGLNGECTDRIAGFLCKCAEGYEGELCKAGINKCTSSPCVHGACSDRLLAYECLCRRGFEGKHCEVEQDTCMSSPCLHGSCYNRPGGYTCACIQGFIGVHCDKPINKCLTLQCSRVDDCKLPPMRGICECLISKDADSKNLSCHVIFQVCSSNPCVGDEPCTLSTYARDFVCACKDVNDIATCARGKAASLQCRNNNCFREDNIKNVKQSIVYSVSCNPRCGKLPIDQKTRWALTFNGYKTAVSLKGNSFNVSNELFHIAPDAGLQVGNYTLHASVHHQEHTIAEEFVTFSIHALPSIGKCLISPEDGYEIETDFTIVCPSWPSAYIKNLKFVAKFFQSDNTVENSIPLLIKSVESSAVSQFELTTKLTLGNPNNYYKTDIMFSTVDEYGQWVLNRIATVTVSPTENEQKLLDFALYYPLQQDKLQLEDMVKLTSIAKQHKELTNEKVMQSVLERVTTELPQLQVKTAPELETALSLSGLVVESFPNMSVSQTSSLANGVNTLGTVFQQNCTLYNFEDKKRTSAAFVFATAILMAKYKNFLKNKNTSISEANEITIENKETIDMVDSTLSAVASSLSVSGESITVNSPKVSVFLSKSQPHDLIGKIIETKQASVILPQDLGPSDEESCYTVEMAFFSENPYWKYNTHAEKGTSLSCGVKTCLSQNSSGSRKKRFLTNLLVAVARNYVVQTLKPDISSKLTLVDRELLTPQQILYHNFTITNQQPIQFSMYPKSGENLEVYLGFDMVPTPSNFSRTFLFSLDGLSELKITSKELLDQKVQLIVLGVRKNCSDCEARIFYKYFFGSLACFVTHTDKYDSPGNTECEIIENGALTIKMKPGKFGVIRSALVISPNPLDIFSVYNSLGGELPANHEVFAVLCLTVLLYLEGLIFLRRLDNRDHKLWKPFILQDNDPSDPFFYEVHIHTGGMAEAGVECIVEMSIGGALNKLQYRHLRGEDKEAHFTQGSTKGFLVSSPVDLGQLKSLDLQIFSVSNPDIHWYLNVIVVIDMQTYQWYPFFYRKWIEASLHSNSDLQHKHSVNLACSPGDIPTQVEAKRNLRYMFLNSHTWISAFYRTIHTTFTRVQCWQCCIFAAMCLMLCNAAWFDTTLGEKSLTIHLGTWEIPVQALVTSVYSTIIVSILTGLLSVAFVKTKMSQKESEQHYMTYAPIPQLRNGGVLPHWTIYITHFTAVLFITTSAFVCFLYSIAWGGVMARIWLVSFAVGILLLIFIIQPIQILGMACFVTYVRRFDTDLSMYYDNLGHVEVVEPVQRSHDDSLWNPELQDVK